MIDSLHIAGFKLFRDLTLPKLGRMNLFVGENNTGKSCLLEAIGLYAGRNPIVDVLQTASLRSAEPLRPWDARGWNEEGTALRHPVFELFHLESPVIGSPIKIETIGDSNPLLISASIRDVENGEVGPLSYVPVNPARIVDADMEFVFGVYRGNKNVAWITRRNLPLSVGILDLTVAHLQASGFSDERAAFLWDQLIQGPGQERVLSWLRLVDPRIQALDYIAGRGISRVALVKVEGQGRIPLKSMGDGLRRMFHIGLAMATASKGTLLIDEFENGLHWRVQRELWEALGKAAQEFDVQIFATTHSRDCVSGFVSASKELGIEDAKLYRLEREGDEIYAVDLNLINVEAALRLNGEFR
jgi:predicted ATPase